MIQSFKDNEIRKSGVIYSSLLEQIKKMHAVDPDKAGELAVSAIELVLTGEMSSDDVMIDMLLQPLMVMRDRDENNYNKKEQAARNKKIESLKLVEIAELYQQKISQKKIGERLGISQQTVSYRLGLIEKEYPELLPNLPKNDGNFTKTTKITNEVLVNNSDNYQNTKITKTTNFVQVGTNGNFVQKEEVGNFGENVSEVKKEKQDFIF